MAAKTWLLTPEGKAWFDKAGKPQLGIRTDDLYKLERSQPQ